MATSKFKRMLNKELSHFSESKSGSQISEFILRTYVDKQEELDLPFLKTNEETQTSGPGTVSTGVFTTGATVGGASGSLTCTSVKVTAVQTSGGNETTIVSSTGTPAATNTSSSTPAAETAFAVTDASQKNKIPAASCMGSITGVKKPVLQHSNSITRLPKYGVPCSPGTDSEEKLGRSLCGINRWGLDIFEIADLTCNRPLTTVMYAIFKQRELLSCFQISATTFLNCMFTLEEHYQQVPYHNSMHAADVAQSVHVLLSSPALEVNWCR